MILVDENMDEAFPEFMPERDVRHVARLGWQGTENGALLATAAEAGLAAFITAD